MQAMPESPQYRYMSNEDLIYINGSIGMHRDRGAQRIRPRDTLWHYTTAAGLIGILESGVLHATNVLYLNDATEYRLITDAALTLSPRDFVEHGHLLVEAIKNYLTPEPSTIPPLFIACVSEAEDQLSQWKGYSRGENGYAIGFDPDEFYTTAVRAGRVVRCQYTDEVGAASIISRMIGSAEHILNGAIARYPEEKPNVVAEFVECILRRASDTYAYTKFVGFHDECEWRTIMRCQTPESIKFKPKGSMLAPYVELPLSETDASGRVMPIKSIRSIIVGPGQHAGISAMATRALLRKRTYAETVEVRVSKLPFRWA